MQAIQGVLENRPALSRILYRFQDDRFRGIGELSNDCSVVASPDCLGPPARVKVGLAIKEEKA